MKLPQILSKLRPSRRGHSGSLRRVPRARRRYRVDIINENSLERVGGVRLTGIRAVLAAAGVFAAVVSLIVVIFIFTPAGYLLPGSLRPAERWQYVDLAVRIDSLTQHSSRQDAYLTNLEAIFTDSVGAPRPGAAPAAEVTTDSLLEASDAERRFVQQFEARENFNLSVLSPIAAEGMTFEAPVTAESGIGQVSAVYRGTVTGEFPAPDGTTALTVQHPNDFVSTYRNLTDVYVQPGQKVASGQRLGQTGPVPLLFELWHSGTMLDPHEYIAY